MADEKLAIISVRSSLPLRNGEEQVALWDRHPEHPKSEKYPNGGEVWVSGKTAVRVAETGEVLQALRDGRLERVSGGSAAAKEAVEEGAGARVEKSAKDGDK